MFTSKTFLARFQYPHAGQLFINNEEKKRNKKDYTNARSIYLKRLKDVLFVHLKGFSRFVVKI